jgi:hypothetical protein
VQFRPTLCKATPIDGTIFVQILGYNFSFIAQFDTKPLLGWISDSVILLPCYIILDQIGDFLFYVSELFVWEFFFFFVNLD